MFRRLLFAIVILCLRIINHIPIKHGPAQFEVGNLKEVISQTLSLVGKYQDDMPYKGDEWKSLSLVYCMLNAAWISIPRWSFYTEIQELRAEKRTKRVMRNLIHTLRNAGLIAPKE